MTVKWITIRVNDLKQSKEFYIDYLGMKEEREFSPNDSMTIVFLAAKNDTKIELIYEMNTKMDGSTPSNVSIGFGTQNYDDLLQEARDMNILTGEPMVLGGNMHCFFVEDPNGIGVQIIKEDK